MVSLVGETHEPPLPQLLGRVVWVRYLLCGAAIYMPGSAFLLTAIHPVLLFPVLAIAPSADKARLLQLLRQIRHLLLQARHLQLQHLHAITNGEG